MHIWAGNTSPDVVLSLGTGTEEPIESPKAPHFRHILNDGFVPRLVRSFKYSLDGERAWRGLKNRLNENFKADYIRFNISLGESQDTRLDDCSIMAELTRMVHLQPNGSRDCSNTAFTLIASAFYFELQSIPDLELGTCQGSLRCRNNPEKIFLSLQHLSIPSLELGTGSERLGSLTQNHVCGLCRRFRKNVVFRIRSLDEPISLYLQSNSNLRRKISGSGNTANWYIQQQGLNASFGTPDHDIPNRLRCTLCGPESTSIQSTKRKALPFLPDKSKRARSCT